MLAKEELRARLRESLDTTIQEVNRALKGENIVLTIAHGKE